VGAALVVTAAVGSAYPLWWSHRSSSAGRELLGRALGQGETSLRPGGANGACANASSGDVVTPQHPAVVEIPAIGLRAPVLEGLDDAVLNVAVGHEPSSAWPGASGESVLLAHDVSYFSDLDRLHDGNEVIWLDGCREDFFRVIGHEIVQPGAALAKPSSGAGLAMITCWPTDSLWWTPDRYVVETAFVGEQFVSRQVALEASSRSRRSVPAWPTGVPKGLFGRADVLVDSLGTAGSPSRSFTEGPEPLDAANRVLSDYAAVEKTVTAREGLWWAALALPGVPLPRPWPQNDVVDVDLSVSGKAIEGASVRSAAVIVVFTVRNDRFYVASVTAQ
jgi:LPXTG-site transpeptidase (sortase) family protein